MPWLSDWKTSEEEDCGCWTPGTHTNVQGDDDAARTRRLGFHLKNGRPNRPTYPMSR